jgi:uncharacterized integral membrane protein
MADGVKSNLRLTGISLAVILVLIVILQNTEEVVTKVLWLDIPMPRALLLFITFLVGFGSGYLVHLRRSRRHRGGDHSELERGPAEADKPSVDLPEED